MLRFALISLLLLGSSGCGHGSAGQADSLRDLPARHDPALDLGDDDDLGRARNAYDALPLGDARRAPQRRELWAAYQPRIERALNESREEAFRRFTTALEMWDASELRDPKTVPADLGLLADAADKVYHSFSATGGDLESATVLAVLAALHPEKTAEYDKTWTDIVSYTDDLAVAEAGPGAERSRAIVILEAVTQHFPSPWAGEKLIKLYLERQDVVDKALKAGAKQEILGAHRDPGVARITWNLVRIYSRLDRLDEAAPAADKLVGQFGDEPEIRKRLHTALTTKDGQDWLSLMAAYLPGERPNEGDAGTSYAICAEGAKRLPTAVEPKKCLAELARIADHVPLAIRWIEEARKLQPDDHDSSEIAARLYLMRIADNVAAERLDAARAQMTEVEAFFADADKRWAGKPLDTTLAHAYVTFARGLYNLGEIDESLAYLDKAKAHGNPPQVGEELANIAMKTGRYADAAKGYMDAAAVQRPTPLDTTFQAALFKRLAGEAYAAAGDRAKAEEVWKKTIDDWRDVIGAGINPRARADVYIEVGRLYWDLGDEKRGREGMTAALEIDPEQLASYGDVISFLVTRGEYDASLDAFHRALGRPEVTEYLKVYASIWLFDLARCLGRDPDPGVVDYLKLAARGNHWYHQLARFKRGELKFDELLAKADTRGKRAEAYFYQATEKYVQKDRKAAEHLLGEVKATRMLGFFEYDMATYYLKNGPPGTKPAAVTGAR
jgi:tetratricopeptide (TPR) repeat protein